MRGAVIAAVVGAVAGEMTCPSTPAAVACGMKLTAEASTTCDKVEAEIKARVGGQYTKWHDPHNNGTYTEEKYGGTVSTSRLTGDGKYTDKQIFTLTKSGDSACKIEACSRSQVFSIGDMGTNYCDLKMLFCGSSDGCKPVLNDFTVSDETTQKFAQATVNLNACLKVASAPGPCCKTCKSGKEHYYSIPDPDKPNAQCGETCMVPGRVKLWKMFEPKLTKGTCASQGFTNYISTETDGPWPVGNTNDRYTKTNSSVEVSKDYMQISV